MPKKVELRTLKQGSMFDQDGKTGILLNVGINVDVLITNLPKTRYYLENESYYKGKHVWSAGTLVTAL